ncbi:MAG: SigE family RNA polymerase sigma factor [Nocardioides sp.]
MRIDKRAGFADFAAARRTHLRRIAFGVCNDWDQAEDLVQTALAKLYVAWPRVRRAGNEEAYARQIIVRTAIDESRRPWRRESPGLDGFDHPSAAGLDPGDRQDLFAALARLPEMQRKVVVLRHWAGLSVLETAEDLGLAEGTVKSHTARALATLHQLLNPASAAY